MPNTLSRILGPVNIAATGSLFSGTSGHIYSIRSIRVTNPTAAPISFALSINGVANSNNIIPTVSIAPNGFIQDDGFFVLNGTNGDSLQATVSGTGLTITVSGLDQS